MRVSLSAQHLCYGIQQHKKKPPASLFSGGGIAVRLPWLRSAPAGASKCTRTRNGPRNPRALGNRSQNLARHEFFHGVTAISFARNSNRRLNSCQALRLPRSVYRDSADCRAGDRGRAIEGDVLIGCSQETGMATTKRAFMKLTEAPEIVTWPETRYVFIEKIGPFQDIAPQAWQDLHQLVPGISEHNRLIGYMSLYKVGPKIYRAGVSLAATPIRLPENGTLLKLTRSIWPRF